MTSTATATRSIDDHAAALAMANSKDALAQQCRAAGWSGDDARTPKMMLARWLAEHEMEIPHSTQAEPAPFVQHTTATAATTAPAPEAKPAADLAQRNAGNVAQAIAGAVAAAMSGVKLGVDPDEIRAAVREEVASVAATLRDEITRQVFRVEIKTPDGTVRDVGRQHKQFNRLVRMVGAGVPVYIAGPAGSGKTTAAEACAKALGLPFYFNGAIDSEYKLSGFVDAQGRIVSTAFRRAYTEGGVYLFDEVDSSSPSALLAFNAALANGHADFPGANEPVKRHKDFRCLAAGNTWGFGATVEYVGRNRMDAAFLDRFARLAWDYDEHLEREIAGNPDWTSRIQTMRAKARAKGLKVVISPRASIFGAQLLAAGVPVSEVMESAVLFGLTKEQRDNLTE